MPTREMKYDVIIAGGGPAGSSAAIHLARAEIGVLLVEQKQFPRPKLCGEFISPECFDHFKKLGVAADMMDCNPSSLTETVFYSRQGHRVAVPSRWFGTGAALGLSRAEMDNNLLRGARKAGADILENATVTDVIQENGRITGVKIRTAAGEQAHRARITIDATGRGRTVSRKVYEGQGRKHSVKRPRLVAFKAHFTGTRVAPGACELYSYRRGYGGLSTIENGISNLCFIVAAKDVRRVHSDPELVLQNTIMTNRRAAEVLGSASRCSEWLSVSLERFGLENPAPTPGLIAIGDSAAFIDPFTGSGMLMALESGELAAKLIADHWPEGSAADLSRAYTEQHRTIFDSRLTICRLLRATAYTPLLADLTIVLCNLSERLRNRLARATRSRARYAVSKP